MKKIITYLILLLCFSASLAEAHGGEDHGGGIPTQAVSGDVLTVTSYPGRYEVFVKYSVPEIGKPVLTKLFFADFATNHPLNPEVVSLSFPGASGAKVVTEAQKVSDGTYTLTLQFDKDTNYTGLLKFIHNGEEQITALSPFYAGTAAKKVIASTSITQVTTHSSNSIFSFWLLIPLILIITVIAYWLLRRSKRRSIHTTTIYKETAVSNKENI